MVLKLNKNLIKYFMVRIGFIPLTLLLIMFVNFLFIQFAPGGPVEYMLSKYQSKNSSSSVSRVAGGLGDVAVSSVGVGSSKYIGAIGLEDEFRKKLEAEYGFDKPFFQRFFSMILKYLTFDFGDSFYQNKSVIDLILSKMPVSISLGVFSVIIVYLIAIPLGIKKAVKNGSKFDLYSSVVVIVMYSIPTFLVAIFLIVFFASDRFLDIFPLRGLVSDNFSSLSVFGKIFDYLWHLVLPVLSLVLSGFASLTILTKNCFLEEMSKLYVQVAKVKGVSFKDILYKHIFRNAMLVVISGIPAMLITMLFTGSLLIEVIFSLDGLGLLGFNSIMTRDYPVVFGSLYIFSLIGLILNVITDFMYVLIDPRISFDKNDY